MRENYRVSCLETTGRASNEQLHAWLRTDAESDGQAFQSLCRAMTPLLLAYFEGQLRGRRADPEALTQETLVAVYLHRASYDPALPFRAWLLELARLRMADHLRGARALPGVLPGVASETERETVRLLHRLARKQVDGMADGRGQGWATA